MIPASGAVTFAQISVELGRSSVSNRPMNEPGTRILTGNPGKFSSGSQISVSDLRSRSAYGFSALMSDLGGGVVGATQGVAGSPTPLGTVNGFGIREIASGRKAAPIGALPQLTQVRMNVPTPYDRFWALGVWNGTAFINVLTYSDHTSEVDDYATNGWIGVGWALPGAAVDLRSYLGSTMHFVFFMA